MIFDAVTTLATVPAILALTNLAKSFGIQGRWSALLAVLLGVAINIAGYLLADAGWWTVAQSGLLLGLGAAGLYDLAPHSDARRAVED